MSEKLRTMSNSGAAPNKMRLYATWVDRTPSNCIPRLCSLTLTRLVVLKPLGSELQSISIAVKMQSTKRTLRSHELSLPANGLLDTLLDLTFCLQYPHFLKREGNKLHISLQRRKRYKNRTMLGYKTLAEGIIRMDQVLQKHMDLELELMSDNTGKEKGASPMARLSVVQISSTPVDQEGKSDHKYDFSDEDEELSSGEEEVGDLSDSEPIRTKMPHARHNLKQRFVSLLRRFRVADSEGGRGADLTNTSDIQALFHELESLSCDEDSGAEQDTMSISSTPKPSLRPFFSSSRSLLDSSSQTFMDTEKLFDERAYSGSDGNADICGTDPEVQSDPQVGSPPKEHISKPEKNKGGDSDFSNIMQELTERKAKLFRSSASSGKKKNSLSVCSDIPIFETITARKTFLDLVSRTLPLEESVLPENIILINGPDNLISPLYSKLAHYKIFQPISSVEVKAVLSQLCNKIHKYFNSCAKTGTLIRLILVGGDALIGWTVRPYVDLLSSRPSDWLSLFRLYVIPVGCCLFARQLTSLDQGYATLFPYEQDGVRADDLIIKLQKYVSAPPSAPFAQLPVAEVMLTCYDDSNQQFIPFINEVRIGQVDQTSGVSVDLDDASCSSPPSAPSLTPPSSPNVQVRELWEPLELQIDYWQCARNVAGVDQQQQKTEKSGKPDGAKVSVKGLFRGIQVTPSSANSGLNVAIQLANKEKKQKIMRLGKKKEKEKDVEPRSQNIDSVSRMICSVRSSHNTPLKVYVDGVEFSGVKFFQLNSTWQSHVKYVPIALVGVPLASAE